jgi:HTH-type transcriptional regulator / antitoxin HipB
VWTNAYSGRDVGRHIAELRKSRGISQIEFAESLGVSRTTLSALENGGSVSSTILVRAISLLGSRIVLAPKSAAVAVAEVTDIETADD